MMMLYKKIWLLFLFNVLMYIKIFFLFLYNNNNLFLYSKCNLCNVNVDVFYIFMYIIVICNFV